MTSQPVRPDPQKILSRLKDFQRKTTTHVFSRLYTDPDRTHRFLLADEVGLGKTLVARGVTALAVDHLWDTVDRIDVVYICSSGDIARQNINRLNLTDSADYALASRVTLLPTQLKDIKSRKMNFISFTPGTSFQLSSSAGRVDERVLLYWLLESAWRFRGAGPLNLMQGAVRDPAKFRARVDRFSKDHQIDPLLGWKFHEALQARAARDREAGNPGLRERFDELCVRFGRTRMHVPKQDSRDQNKLIGDLRALLAATCIRALEPDLVILDEFQRFKDLLTEKGEDGEGEEESALAQELFDYTHSTGGDKTRILMLSATPYKMYTTVDESGGDDHYADFLQTLRFLQDDETRTKQLAGTLQSFRQALHRLGEPGAPNVSALRDQLESELRRVMIRTERLAASTDRSGMLREIPSVGIPLVADEALAYRALQRLGRHIEHSDTIEYWKAAPYLLSFMDDYQFKRKLEDDINDGDEKVQALLRESPELVVPREVLHGKSEVAIPHARLSWLLRQTVDTGAWKLLWLPPSMPYYRPEGAYALPGVAGFTKRLVFSAWHVVPKVTAALLSHEAERRMLCAFDDRGESLTEIRDKLVPLLRFRREDDRLGGMPVLALVYPSMVLARLGDPRGINDGPAMPDAASILSAIEARLEPLLARTIERHAVPGAVDDAWYWAAPILMDAEESPYLAASWLDRRGAATQWIRDEEGEDSSAGGPDLEFGPWGDHVARARDAALGRIRLGAPPADLGPFLARLALAGPAVAALRALARQVDDQHAHQDERVRDAAGRIAWGFRNLFNLPEVIALVRGSAPDEAYWRLVLDYAVEGNIQSVLDEYLHVLTEALGLFDKAPAEVVSRLSREVRGAMGLRTAAVGVDELTENGKNGGLTLEKRRMRARFASRFGDEKSIVDEVGNRKDAVRSSFNSPFWPFVLTSTSVGQEGLDFHLYCHAVVHWNLPSNPVDLEQREGRVHRYKGHAVRKNIATRYADAVRSRSGDPWKHAFEMARMDRPVDASDVVPYWVFQVENGAAIERHAPMLPLSRDAVRLGDLRRALALYRMVFGQPRQDELLEFLLRQLPQDQVERVLNELRIDLSPR